MLNKRRRKCQTFLWVDINFQMYSLLISAHSVCARQTVKMKIALILLSYAALSGEWRISLIATGLNNLTKLNAHFRCVLQFGFEKCRGKVEE
jgi:hypothetical protein